MTHPCRLLTAALLVATALAAPAVAKPAAKTRPPAERIKLVPAKKLVKGAGWWFLHHYPHAPAAPAVDAAFAKVVADSEKAFKADLQEMFGPALAVKPVPKNKAEWSLRETTYQVRHNGGLLAVEFDQTQALGGARYFQNVGTVTIMDGKVLQLADLFKPGANWLPELSRRFGAALKQQQAERRIDIQNPKGYGPDAKNFAAFLPTPRGLSVFFQHGEVAPEAANTIEATVGWPELATVVKPAIAKAAMSQ